MSAITRVSTPSATRTGTVTEVPRGWAVEGQLMRPRCHRQRALRCLPKRPSTDPNRRPRCGVHGQRSLGGQRCCAKAPPGWREGDPGGARGASTRCPAPTFPPRGRLTSRPFGERQLPARRGSPWLPRAHPSRTAVSRWEPRGGTDRLPAEGSRDGGANVTTPRAATMPPSSSPPAPRKTPRRAVPRTGSDRTVGFGAEGSPAPGDGGAATAPSTLGRVPRRPFDRSRTLEDSCRSVARL